MLPLQEPTPAPRSILVVEDDLIQRLVIAEELRGAGFIVIEAMTAQQALDWIDGGGLPDLVFSDVQLPGGKSGVDLAATLRDTAPALPVILTSGGGPPQESGCPHFVPKPYEIEAVVAVIRHMLGLPGRGLA